LDVFLTLLKNFLLPWGQEAREIFECRITLDSILSGDTKTPSASYHV
jgi:hypothetical protein